MKASCGAPAFTLGGDVTDSDVEVYYMEYAANEITLNGDWPETANGLTQIPGVPDYTDARTLNLAGELPYFKTYSTQLGGASRFLTVPGNTIADRIAAKQVEIDNYDAAATEFNTYVAFYNQQFEEAKELGTSLYDEIFEDGYYGVKFRFPYPDLFPSQPTPYTGPGFGSDSTGTLGGVIEQIYDFGMGLFTADTLTMAAGGKSFGALGQGNLKNSAGEEIPDTITTYGSRLEKEKLHGSYLSYSTTDDYGNALTCTASY